MNKPAIKKIVFNRKTLTVFWIVMSFFLPGPGLQAKQQPQQRKVVLPFDLDEVTLHSSLFTQNRDKTIAYLKFLDAERLLHNFRVAAGIPSSAKPLGGWEKPDIKLRGHSLGHVMTALAQAYAGSGDPALKKKLDYIVSELGKCQDLLPARGNPEGFLSAYSVEQFDKLEELTTYPNIWAPYYTLHKIMAGLLAAYHECGNRQALEIAEKISGWVVRQLGDINDKLLQDMWNLYIAGEYGGMNEVMAEMYALTGNKNYLATARKFDKNRVIQPTANNRDKLVGLHANQHIPQVTGYLKIYSLTGDQLYYKTAKNFWSFLAEHRAYINGGVSEGEMLKDPDRFASFLTDRTCETCCAYNMLKLSRQLFFHDPQPKYMDYYERALYNQILASQDPEARHTAVTYFMPLGPGCRKGYSNDYHAFTCCHGTGMENHTKYQDSIYFRSRNNDTLYVNLYIPSDLDWKERGIRITQDTAFPVQQGSSLVFHGSGGRFKVKLRVPYWATGDFTVKINGKLQELEMKPGSYVTLDRKWKNRDKIDIAMPFALRLERLPDVPSIGGFMTGPFLLVGTSDQEEWIHLYLDPENLGKNIKATRNPLEYAVQGMNLVPMFKAHGFRYHTYYIILDEKKIPVSNSR